MAAPGRSTGGPATADGQPEAANCRLDCSPQTTCHKQRFTVRPGDRLFFAGDGVTEAGPRGAEPFGEKRLQGVLLATARQPPHEAVRQVLRTVSAYQQGAFRDDATALCLDWRSRDQT